MAVTITLADLDVDPHPILARLLADEPVCVVESMQLWFVTRWDDVVFVCENDELFTAATEAELAAVGAG